MDLLGDDTLGGDREIPPRPDKDEIRKMMLRHARLQLEYKGEFSGIREMRKHVAWYTKGLKGAARLREKSERGGEP